jgi:hypothetical protein
MTHLITSHYRISFYISFLIFFLTSQHDNFHHKASLVMFASNLLCSEFTTVRITVMYIYVCDAACCAMAVPLSEEFMGYIVAVH